MIVAGITIDSLGNISGTMSSNGGELFFDENLVEVDYFEYQEMLDNNTCGNFYYELSTSTILPKQQQGTMVDKLSFLADGIDHVTITGAPLGAFTATNVITGDTVSGPISGLDTFSTTISGNYKIKIVSFTYFDFEAIIEAT